MTTKGQNFYVIVISTSCGSITTKSDWDKLVLMMKLHVAIVIALSIFVFLMMLLPRHRWCRKSRVKFRLIDLVANGVRKVMLMKGSQCMNTQVCRENLFKFDDVMKHFGLTFWLSEGTALGAVREGRFIPHDDDVDVATFIENIDMVVQSVLPILVESGFKVVKVWNEGRFITLERGGEYMDIDFVEEGKPCMFMTVGKVSNGFHQCDDLLRILQGLHRVEFLGRQFLVPGDDYLVHQYGPTWRVPNKTASRCDPIVKD